jgi:hypothetical protein
MSADCFNDPNTNIWFTNTVCKNLSNNTLYYDSALPHIMNYCNKVDTLSDLNLCISYCDNFNTLFHNALNKNYGLSGQNIWVPSPFSNKLYPHNYNYNLFILVLLIVINIFLLKIIVNIIINNNKIDNNINKK